MSNEKIIQSELDKLYKYCEQDGFIKATYMCFKHKINMQYLTTILCCLATCSDDKNVYFFESGGITILAKLIDGELFLNKQIFMDIKVI